MKYQVIAYIRAVDGRAATKALLPEVMLTETNSLVQAIFSVALAIDDQEHPASQVLCDDAVYLANNIMQDLEKGKYKWEIMNQ